MTNSHYSRCNPWSRLIKYYAAIAIVALIGQYTIEASTIDHRCESVSMIQSIEDRLWNHCEYLQKNCIKEHLTQFSESLLEAEEVCYSDQLYSDPSFTGKCALLLDELETPAYEGENWLLPKLYFRTLFYKGSVLGEGMISYKSFDSELRIRRFLTKEPNNYVALTILGRLLGKNDLVESIELEIKMHELDPDCSRNWRYRPKILMGYVYNLVRNWSAGTGPGSDLPKKTIESLIRKAGDTLLDMYDLAIDLSEGEHKLKYSLKSLIISDTFSSNGPLVERASSLELDLDSRTENRRQSIIRKLVQEYGVESTRERSRKLEIMCNDYAFELELEPSCIELLEHFSLQDADSGESLANDWTRAAILLVNRVTYDCSPSEWITGDSGLFNERRCLADQHELLLKQVHDLFSRLAPKELNANGHLLQAYLQMNKNSVEHYRRAIRLDGSVASFAPILSKRLYRRGAKDAAISILEMTISARNKGTIASIDTMRSHEVENLESLYDSIRRGRYYHFFESPRYEAGVVEQ